MPEFKHRNNRRIAALLAAGSSILAGGAYGAVNPAQTANTTTTPSTVSAGQLIPPDEASYDIGLMMGGQIAHDGLSRQISMDALLKGLREALDGRRITPAQHEAAMTFMHNAREALSEQNRAAARDFLEKNAKRPGIVSLPSGLQYKILAAGAPQGKPPAPTDLVTVSYRASLIDGTEIDRSDAHGRPASFRVNSVFKAWQEAFAAMKPGAKWQLFVPPELGYGKNSPPTVPPGALLIYDLELLQIESAPAVDIQHSPAGGNKREPENTTPR